MRAEVSLNRLHYALHLGERARLRRRPAAGSRDGARRASPSLAAARDATAEVAEALTDRGPTASSRSFPSGAVRSSACALPGFASRRPSHAKRRRRGPRRRDRAPLVAFLLALVGALAFVAGATFGLWPRLGRGIVAVCASIFAYRP